MIKKISRLSYFFSLAFSIISFADPEISQTIVEEHVDSRRDTTYIYVKDKSVEQQAGDASMLFHIPGLTLTQTGGPLSPSQIRYRGLSDSRFHVDLEGLQLTNSINGITDANSLFLFAAKNLQTNAQSLSISLPTVDHAEARGIIGYGSQNTIKVGGSTGLPLDKYSSLFIAMQAYSTNGRFSFRSPDTTKTSNFTRENNDQHRVQAVAKYQRATENRASHALFAINAHEGGLPGFAHAPTDKLRNQALYSGLKLGFMQKIKDAKFNVDLANSLFDYRSADNNMKGEHFTSSTHELTIGINTLKLPAWLDFDFAEQFIFERAYELNKSRIGGGLLMTRTMRFRGTLKPKVFAQFNMLGFHDYGLLFKKDFGFSISPSDNFNLTARFLRRQRLPTFMELYGQNRFFVGNTNLTKESVWDLELSSTFNIGDNTRMHVTGFTGSLSDVIVYVPLNGVTLQPSNIKKARRHGLDISFVTEPFSWLMFETKNSLLTTKNSETKEPLPHAPWFSGLSKLRFGNEDFLALSLQSRYRGPASGDIYGSLRTSPYALFDGLISVRSHRHVGLSLSVTNIFNVKTARDTYETPMPGTAFFAQIEIGNL